MTVEGFSDVTVGCDESTEDSEGSEPCVALITGPGVCWCVFTGLNNSGGLPQGALFILEICILQEVTLKNEVSQHYRYGDAKKMTGSVMLQCLTVFVCVFYRNGSDSQEAGDCRRWSVR